RVLQPRSQVLSHVNGPPPTATHTLPLHDALPIFSTAALAGCGTRDCRSAYAPVNAVSHWLWRDTAVYQQRATLRYTLAGYLIHRSEEHTSELQSRENLVCRLLPEKKKKHALLKIP